MGECRWQGEIETVNSTDKGEISSCALFWQTYIKIVQYKAHLRLYPVFLSIPSLLTSLLRGRWGTFLDSSFSTLGINPLQLCPLLPYPLPPASHPSPLLISLLWSFPTPAGPSILLWIACEKCSKSVTHVKQTRSVPRHSHIPPRRHTFMCIHKYTHWTMCGTHLFICCLNLLDSSHNRSRVTHMHTLSHSCQCVQKIPSGCAPKPLLWD